MSKQQTLFLGAVLIVLGMELRAVESFTLRPETTRFLANVTEGDTPVGNTRKYVAENVPIKKTVTPPVWAGWALLSGGVVAIAYALRVVG